MSRPSIYTDDLAVRICQRLAAGDSLRSICADDEMPNASTVHAWVLTHEEFSKQYARAREMQAEHYLDEIIEIADDSMLDKFVDDNGSVRTDSEVVARSRLRVDTRKWAMSKMAPRKYGDKITNEHTGKDGGPIETKELSDNDRARRFAFILAKGMKAKK